MGGNKDNFSDWSGESAGLENALRYAFGTTEPQVAKYPHWIISASDEALRHVLNVAGEPAGIWGNAAPLVDENGMNYLEPPDSRIVEDFRLWRLPENQEWVIERGAGGSGFASPVEPLENFRNVRWLDQLP